MHSFEGHQSYDQSSSKKYVIEYRLACLVEVVSSNRVPPSHVAVVYEPAGETVDGRRHDTHVETAQQRGPPITVAFHPAAVRSSGVHTSKGVAEYNKKALYGTASGGYLFPQDSQS